MSPNTRPPCLRHKQSVLGGGKPIRLSAHSALDPLTKAYLPAKCLQSPVEVLTIETGDFPGTALYVAAYGRGCYQGELGAWAGWAGAADLTADTVASTWSTSASGSFNRPA